MNLFVTTTISPGEGGATAVNTAASYSSFLVPPCFCVSCENDTEVQWKEQLYVAIIVAESNLEAQW